MFKRAKALYFIILGFIVLIHSGLLARLASFSYPELFLYPFLAENGLLPYKQILDQHFPSILMMPLNIFDFGLRSSFSARLFSIGLVTVSHIVLFLIAKKFFKSPRKALLANVIYLILQPLFEGSTLWLDSFLVPILLLTFYFLLLFFEGNKLKTLIIAGVFLGLSLFLKQTIFPLVVLVILYLYLETKNIKKILIFVFFTSAPLIMTVAWVYSKGILNEFFYWTYQFNFEVYASMGRKLPTFNQLLKFLIIWGPALWLIVRKRKKQITILAIFTLASLATAFSRFELVHLQPSMPFAVLLAADFLSSPKNIFKYYFTIVFIFFITLISLRFYQSARWDTAYFFDETTLQTAAKVVSLTRPEEKIFVLGTQPTVYFISERLPAGNVFTVNLPWNMKVAQGKILTAITDERPSLVVYDRQASIDGIKISEFSQDLGNFIDRFYTKIDQVGPNEIMVAR